MPLWKKATPKGFAVHRHLYTRLVSGQETDDIERWFNNEFETPAAGAIQRGLNDQKLKSVEWEQIIRFAAAQSVRTPAFFVKERSRWELQVPELLSSSLQAAVERMAAKKAGRVVLNEPPAHAASDHIPIRVFVEREGEKARLTAVTIAGRGLWQFAMRHLLTETLKTLEQQKWSIVKPAPDFEWFTSDDPVVRLNYYGAGRYDFKGGWGSPGSEIFLPLGPQHLLFTSVGNKPLLRGSRMSIDMTQHLRRFIAEHAYLMIFAQGQDEGIATIRPRSVSPVDFDAHTQFWRNWHVQQTKLERDFAGMTSSGDLGAEKL